METSGLTKKKAATILARAWNNLDVNIIEPYIAEDIIYWSQQVLTDMTGKKAVVEYLTEKMETIRKLPGAQVFAELGETKPYPMAPNPPEPCVILAQGDKNNIDALVLLKIESGKINSIALCSDAPHPSTARRSGEYPD
jgi:hypothetical protein